MVKHAPYDTFIDIYSWGMCLYALDHLSNVPPTTAGEQIQVNLQDFKYLTLNGYPPCSPGGPTGGAYRPHPVLPIRLVGGGDLPGGPTG